MAEPIRFQHFEVPLREDGTLYELGRGAMGVTYKAFDTNLRCFVALKVINAAYLTSDVARQRFLREARAAAALRHPNVAAVFHLGEEDGNCFYAMELVDGETVEEKMKREGAIPADTALEIVLQVARALGAAQKQGLVHRDIKPSNLMLVREDEGEFTVKVIDFGLAKSTSGGNEDTATITISGFLGTPHFASPEQLEERDLDVRSDIYSLGVTLYYMLAGRTPFSGSLAQVMSQHLHREPPLEKLSGQPPQVIDLLRHMLEKNADERPQTPAELRREIEACRTTLKSMPSLTPSSPPDAESFETQALDEIAPASPENLENFETQELDAPPPSTEPVDLSPGAVVAGRYRILNEEKTSNFGRVFKAELVETSALLALLVLDTSQLASSEAYTRLEDQVVALHSLNEPALRRVYSLERVGHISFLTLEWTAGPSLLDLMRSRKVLPLAEALWILRPLAAGFDAMESAGISCPDLSAHEVLVPGTDIQRPIPSEVTVKFTPLSPDAASAAPGVTVVSSAFAFARESGAFSGSEARAFVYALASLAYELLGGIRAGSSSGAPVPIAGLSETANIAIRRALHPKSAPFPKCAAFLDSVEGLEVAGLEEEVPESIPEEAIAPQEDFIQQSAPPSVFVPPVMPQMARPQPGSRLPTVWIAAGSAVVLLGATGAFFLIKPPPPVPVVPAIPTATAPILAATPAQPTPQATPAPTTDPIEITLNRILQAPEVAPASTLSSLLALGRTNLDKPKVHKAVEDWLIALRKKLSSMNSTERDSLKNPLEQAVPVGFPDAAILLGKLTIENDPKAAYSCFLDAAKQENVYAMVEVGQMLANGQVTSTKDFAAAAKWFQSAADLEYPTAMLLLGNCYLNGTGVDADPARAVKLLTQAADKNNAHAMLILGDLYNKGGAGVTKNVNEAFRLFSKATELKLLDAQGSLGALYASGKASGFEPDAVKAVELWKNGADQGNALCMAYYAKALEAGEGGLIKNSEQARSWYVRAANRGNPIARAWCEEHNVLVPPR